MNPSGQQDRKPHKEDRLQQHEVMFHHQQAPSQPQQEEMQWQMSRESRDRRQASMTHHRAWALALVLGVLALAVWSFGFVGGFGWLGYLCLFVVLIVTLFAALLLW